MAFVIHQQTYLRLTNGGLADDAGGFLRVVAILSVIPDAVPAARAAWKIGTIRDALLPTALRAADRATDAASFAFDPTSAVTARVVCKIVKKTRAANFAYVCLQECFSVLNLSCIREIVIQRTYLLVCDSFFCV